MPCSSVKLIAKSGKSLQWGPSDPPLHLAFSPGSPGHPHGVMEVGVAHVMACDGPWVWKKLVSEAVVKF